MNLKLLSQLPADLPLGLGARRPRPEEALKKPPLGKSITVGDHRVTQHSDGRRTTMLMYQPAPTPRDRQMLARDSDGPVLARDLGAPVAPYTTVNVSELNEPICFYANAQSIGIGGRQLDSYPTRYWLNGYEVDKTTFDRVMQHPDTAPFYADDVSHFADEFGVAWFSDPHHQVAIRTLHNYVVSVVPSKACILLAPAAPKRVAEAAQRWLFEQNYTRPRVVERALGTVEQAQLGLPVAAPEPFVQDQLVEYANGIYDSKSRQQRFSVLNCRVNAVSPAWQCNEFGKGSWGVKVID